MKDKILFWLDVELIHFGIAKFLQEKYDCELFAIYDLNHHLKKSFLNQQLVKFQKVWYFWDHVSKIMEKSPNLQYLSSFEEKYKINLWLIAYSERNFNQHNLFYKFKNNEILSILEQECRFFEDVLDEIKPNFLIIKTTDFHRNHLLSELCRSRGIHVLMLYSTNVGYRSTIISEVNRMKIDNSQNENKNYDQSIDLHGYLTKFNKFEQSRKFKSARANVSPLQQIKRFLEWMIKTFDREYRNSYDHYGITRTRAIIKTSSLILKGKFRKFFIDKNFIHQIDNDGKFVYFPLQVQPERNVDIGAPFYTNQLEVIINIAKSLPVGYKLYVKEHYNMIHRHWRSISEYKAILDLPNVKLIHPSVKPEEILSKCSLVVTIAGSSGLEAAFHKKPSIVFADVIYAGLPSVHRLKSIEDLPQAIKTSLQKEVDVADVNKFLDVMNENTFEFDEMGLIEEFFYKFNPAGFLISDRISMSELDLFLEEKRSIFEKLALEHMKKITEYKKLINTRKPME